MKWVGENRKLVFFTICFVTTTLIAYFLDFKSELTKSDGLFRDVSVEFHGLLFDLLLFGIVFTIFEYYQDKKDRINTLLDDLDDYRGWNSEEGILKQIGTLYRLLKRGYTKVVFTKTYLHGIDTTSPRFKEIKEFNFTAPNKDYSDFYFNNSKLKDISFNEYYSKDVHFCFSRFNNLLFNNCNLIRCYFNKCSSVKVTFADSYINNAEFILGETAVIEFNGCRVETLFLLVSDFTRQVRILSSDIDELLIFPYDPEKIEIDSASECKLIQLTWEDFCEKLFSTSRMELIDNEELDEAYTTASNFEGSDSEKIISLNKYYNKVKSELDFIIPDKFTEG